MPEQFSFVAGQRIPYKPFCSGNPFSKKCLEKLVLLAKQSRGSASKKLIEKAFFLSKEAHANQVRANKKPYFIHPLETAAILAGLGLSSQVVAAGLLHDVIEDTPIKPEKIRKMFGKEVASLVEGVTKLDLFASESRRKNSLHNLHYLLFATTRDPRVILIKIADKLHNLRTLQFLPAKDRKRIASEALMIYVPIAHKIGLEEIAAELEDLAFLHSNPEEFSKIEGTFKPMCSEKESEINLMIAILKKRLPNAVFCKTTKSMYAIYAKMLNTNKLAEEMNDCVILNVIVKEKKDCYAVLGIIHGLFPPLPNKVKDFIASPKPNLYRVLQTTVFGPKKKPVKVRIATKEMDEINREGVIAWRHRFGEKVSPQMKQTLSRLEALLKNGKHHKLMDLLRADFLGEPIYVFNSKGMLFELPKNSTVLDFAFASEKKWAMHISGAKVNGKNAALDKRLGSGQVVELFFSKKTRAAKRWLNYTKSFLAKKTIKETLKTKN